MTPERAQQLLNRRTRIGNVDFRTIEVGSIRKHMTTEEVEFVQAYWKRLPGSSSFYTTLLRIAADIHETA